MQIEQAMQMIRHPVFSTSLAMTWADFGCGSGVFTHALAKLLIPGSRIYAIDKDLHQFRKASIPGIQIDKVQADFISGQLNLGKLDGILMANALHFVPNKLAFIEKAKSYFKARSTFLIVAYDTDRVTPWIPYPVSFGSLDLLFASLGFRFIEKLHEQPSKLNQHNLYSAYISE